ncbi:TonB-dependent receptor [Ancylomarina sp. DW003]|nr:TonB-dependent receptor [Ancylomarina sp. DW003]MDE5421782.1 TonB-dependent receptor [Ancylomarina sp. DW003]
MRIKSILLTVALATMCLFGQAQEQRDLKKEVKVRTNFKPKIRKAKRIGEMPTIVDTVTFKKRFDYLIKSKSLDVSFKPGTIKAAKMINTPFKKIHGHTFDLAAGNYASLFADYRYNNLHSKKTDFGIHLQHYSSNGKLELENGDKVKPDWKEFLAEVYGNHYLDDAKLSSRIFFTNKAFNYYGLPVVDNINDKENIFDYKNQRFNHIGLNTNYESLNKRANDLNYKLGVNFEYFEDKYNVSELKMGVDGLAELKAGDGMWSLESALDFIKTNNLVYWDSGLKDHDVSSSLLSVNPSYSLTLGNFNMRLGAKAEAVIGNDSEFKIYPDVKFNLVLVERVLDMFAGLDGNLDLNTLRSISATNPFVQSGLDVENTSTNYRIYGGLKTRISTKSSALLSVEYADIENQYFFTMANSVFAPQGDLPSQTHYFNKYAVTYDDISKLSFTGEVDLQLNKELNLYALAKYTHYSLEGLKEAWHMPKFEMEARANYKFSDQWLFNARLIFVGDRPVMTNGNKAQLDALADLGLGAEYKWNDILSLYANVNNILDAESYLWYAYPTQGINGMIGLRLIF